MEVKHRAARSLVHRLASAPVRSGAFAEAAAEIRRLSKDDPEMRSPLAESGAVPLLGSALLEFDSSAAEAQENASAALLNLSISAREAVMSTPGILDALAAALRLPCPSTAQNAAATVYSLLSVDEYRPIIGSKRSVIAALLDLFRGLGVTPTRSIKDALKAIFLLALYPLNRATLVEMGAVPPLFALVVKDGRRGVVEDATAVISQVAGCYESVEAFRRVAGVAILVELVDAATGASGRARENAAAALLNLVMSGGDKAVGDIMESEGAESLVRELAEGVGGEVSARGKSKAADLLRVLQRSRGSHLVHGLQEDTETSTDSAPQSLLFSSSSYTVLRAPNSKETNYINKTELCKLSHNIREFLTI
ncbi:protein spotted leaf 11-like [Zingiber officinale]|uniref:protein spotted leaf 11-like n=1 Tax=Zingiber officinale TaxID=94328 RepID=UPI001C4D6ADF|nr:protein spotted leaf 11-like [Zingiber officinale]